MNAGGNTPLHVFCNFRQTLQRSRGITAAAALGAGGFDRRGLLIHGVPLAAARALAVPLAALVAAFAANIHTPLFCHYGNSPVFMVSLSPAKMQKATRRR